MYRQQDLTRLSVFSELNKSNKPNIKCIYVDGVFDLFHQGHRNVIQNAILKTKTDYPNTAIKILVGVCDEGVSSYKRETIMTLDERVALISEFMKALQLEQPDVMYEIIENSPISYTAEYALKHAVDIFYHGNDFDSKKIDQYYGEVKSFCKLGILPYTQGVSTTELIVRAYECEHDDEVRELAHDIIERIKQRPFESFGISEAVREKYSQKTSVSNLMN